MNNKKVLVTIQKTIKFISVEDDKHRSYSKWNTVNDIDFVINSFLNKYYKNSNEPTIRYKYI